VQFPKWSQMNIIVKQLRAEGVVPDPIKVLAAHGKVILARPCIFHQ
jgi:hypothetical protein